MLLDAECGHPIEVEVIFGEVVRMAKQRNVDIPVSEHGSSFWVHS
jgi:2-dehydropantoate 2-reductase